MAVLFMNVSYASLLFSKDLITYNLKSTSVRVGQSPISNYSHPSFEPPLLKKLIEGGLKGQKPDR